VDDHLSKRHTRGLNRTGCPPSVLSCTAWGFSCRHAYAGRGELLPRLFTLACAKKRTVVLSKNRRCLFCDTFRQRPLSRTPPAYSTRHAAVWCSDFPPANLAIHQRSSAIDRILAHFAPFTATSGRRSADSDQKKMGAVLRQSEVQWP
jgi:hypothetical protein